jgi:hypothetical protein
MRFLEDVGMSPFIIAIRLEVPPSSCFNVILGVAYLLSTSTVILVCTQCRN